MKSLFIGQGHVYHSREAGARHSFRYPTFFLQFSCSQEDQLQKQLRKQFYGALSLSSRQYLDGQEGSFDENIKKFLSEFCDYKAQDVFLQTLPKMFGYAFNPVSFWFCKKDQELEAVLVEVNNTFGERHFYWIQPSAKITETQWLKAEKVFHVSPFFPVEGYYQFRFQLNAQHSRVDINYHGPDEKLRLATWVSGQLTHLEEIHLLPLLSRYGWMTPLILIRIHFQALRLWLKKSRFYSKPALPGKKVSS